jgi:hypothetical protein
VSSERLFIDKLVAQPKFEVECLYSPSLFAAQDISGFGTASFDADFYGHEVSSLLTVFFRVG